MAAFQQGFEEPGEKKDIRVEGQDPVPARQGDGLILGGGEADVLIVVNDGAAVLVMFQNVHGSVRGGVVDDDDLEAGMLLTENRVEALPDESAAVVRNDGYGDEFT